MRYKMYKAVDAFGSAALFLEIPTMSQKLKTANNKNEKKNSWTVALDTSQADFPPYVSFANESWWWRTVDFPPRCVGYLS